MKKRLSQTGEMNVLLIPLILLTLFLMAAAAFGYWAYAERQDYKNNSDQKAATAASEARREEGIAKDKAFVEAEKQPLTAFDGPSAFGSIHIDYPKTWSVYIHSTTTSNQPLDAYFNPRTVPSVQDQASVFALRVQVVQQSYSKLVASYDAAVKKGTVTITPYTLPKVPDVVGIRADGLIRSGKKTTGSMVIMPLRDKSIQIWTENAQSINDFNTIILPNVTFSP
ncbi:MAG: hypothetical protein JWP13_18 [Candidatus Saccharibacteria bacterium]|nr:hypothetical protein [Candidatus Saccharibacteria bacterium]